jgi:ribosomal protein S18 acetylase RimI-like enzyme
MEITYRKIEDPDLPFLQKVYKSTREEELQLTDWSDEQKQQFTDQQFEAQHSYYQQVYKDASFGIIFSDNKPAGRLYLWESEKQIRIVDISLLPEFRNQGIGGAILNNLIEKSELTSKVLSIHVESYNRALSLYKRLGFEQKDHTGVYFYLERQPCGNS